MVGVESGLLMFPINILIITIFRSIRPRVVSKNDKTNLERNLKPFAVTVPSILKVCWAFDQHTPSPVVYCYFLLFSCHIYLFYFVHLFVSFLGYRGGDFLGEQKCQKQTIRDRQAGIHCWPVTCPEPVTWVYSAHARYFKKTRRGKNDFRVNNYTKRQSVTGKNVWKQIWKWIQRLVCIEFCALLFFVCDSIKGESESDLHLVYCSKFLLAGLCHLLMCLEKLDGKNFSCPEEYQWTLNTTKLLVCKAEMVLTSHLTCGSEHKHTRKWTFPQTFLKYRFFLCYACCENIQQSLLYAPLQSSSDRREEEKEFRGLLATLVVCVPGLVAPAVHQRGVHFLHLVVRFWIRQRKVHQVGHVSGPLPVPEHLYTAASQGDRTPSSHFL